MTLKTDEWHQWTLLKLLLDMTELIRQKLIALYISFPNPLHPNIKMHILHTVLHTFLGKLTRRWKVLSLSWFYAKQSLLSAWSSTSLFSITSSRYKYIYFSWGLDWNLFKFDQLQSRCAKKQPSVHLPTNHFHMCQVRQCKLSLFGIQTM